MPGAAPDGPAGNTPTTDDGADRRLIAFNDTNRPYPRDATVATQFESVVGAHPDRPALVASDITLRYAELNQRANQLAHLLRRHGVQRATPVGLHLDRSVEFVVAVLAVLKSGGLYVPLAPDQPTARLERLTEISAPTLILSKGPGPGGSALLDLDSPETAAALARQPVHNPDPLASALDPAYVMFTSGSTGIPKGVVVPHRAILRLVHGTDFLPWGPDLRFLLIAPIAFDASTLELWGPLLHGGTCVVFPDRYPSPDRLGDAIARHGITSMWLTAGLFNQLIDQRPEILRSLRHLLTGGEALSVPHIERALQALPDTQLINGYGPTESTTFTTTFAIPRPLPSPRWDNIPIGRPIANTRCHVLDEQRTPVPLGEPGELFIAGDGLALGYWRQSELTDAAFVPCPFDSEPGAKMYRSGDRVRWRPDGTLEFLGRVDEQLKIRGNRIEPGEVEHAILSHPGVREAAVLGRVVEGGRELVAVIAPTHEVPPTVLELREHLVRHLPAAMIPSRWEWLERLPLSENGKVDRRRLLAEPAPALPVGTPTSPAPHETLDPVESRIAECWRRILRVPDVGRHDDFLDLGGHSLLALRLAIELGQQFRVRVPWAAVFQHRTVAALAALVRTLEPDASLNPAPGLAPNASPGADVIPVTQRTRGPASSGQTQFAFLHQRLADATAYHVPFAFRLRGQPDWDRLDRAWTEVVGRHSILRTRLLWQDDQLLQEIVDLQGPHLSPPDGRPLADELLASVLRDECRRPFVLDQAPLWRIRAWTLAGGDAVLIFTFHHAVVDEWTVRLFFRDLSDAYQNPGTPASGKAAPDTVSHIDFALWQCAFTDGPASAPHRAFWRTALDHLDTVPAFPASRPVPARETGAADREVFTVDANVRQRLERIAHEEGCSAFMVGLAAFSLWIGRETGAADVVVGTPFSLRHAPCLQESAGFLINTVPIRTRLTSEDSFRDLLRRVRATVLDCAGHVALPSSEIIRIARQQSGPEPAIFRHLFVLLEETWPALELPGLDPRSVPVHVGASKSNLALSLTAGTESGWIGEFEYSCDLLDAAAAAGCGARFQDLLRTLATSEGQSIAVATSPSVLRSPGALRAADESTSSRGASGTPAATSPSPPSDSDTDTRLVLEVWRDVLGNVPMNADSDFFALGGHSLLAMQVGARLKARTGLEVGVHWIFQAPTARALGRALETMRRTQGASPSPAATLKALPRRRGST